MPPLLSFRRLPLSLSTTPATASAVLSDGPRGYLSRQVAPDGSVPARPRSRVVESVLTLGLLERFGGYAAAAERPRGCLEDARHSGTLAALDRLLLGLWEATALEWSPWP
jgi:hypothetical protein